MCRLQFFCIRKAADRWQAGVSKLLKQAPHQPLGNEGKLDCIGHAAILCLVFRLTVLAVVLRPSFSGRRPVAGKAHSSAAVVTHVHVLVEPISVLRVGAMPRSRTQLVESLFKPLVIDGLT